MRLVLFIAALLAAACSSSSSSSGPKDVFAGTWSGLTASTTITATTTQQGKVLTGTGTAVSLDQNLTSVVTGTSAPPFVTLKMTFSDGDVVVFTGIYITADSVAGVLANASPGDSVSAPFSFTKRQ